MITSLLSTRTCLVPIIALTLGISYSAQAGWGDMLKNIEQQAPQLLNDLGNSSNTALPANVDTETLARGLLEALKIGSQRAIDTLSQPDGYFANPQIKITVPTVLQPATTLLNQYGLGSVVQSLELSMNRAAEQAAPQAKQHLLNAIEQMSITDAKKIYQGGDDAATRYFESKTRDQLKASLTPIINQAMANAQVARYYQLLLDQAKRYPLVTSLGGQLDLQNHVTEQALDGLFTQLAKEEQQIRQDPVARSTELLKKVFGS